MIKTSNFAHLRAGVAPMILGVALLSTNAYGQEAAEDAVETEGQAIIVTGTRIARPELQAATPIAVVSSDEISRTGQTNASEILRRQPIFSTGISQGNSNFNTAGNGLNLLDLRGLGTSRTLVLLNGRRVVAGL
ncbi:MAG TPA: TonB-dependent receptor plug domain-containing protein, partial [Rhizorhapis sp.]|nr:TonB-dependent receptor plug domain-containing protein [Rhizorhapis sp.]